MTRRTTLALHISAAAATTFAASSLHAQPAGPASSPRNEPAPPPITVPATAPAKPAGPTITATSDETALAVETAKGKIKDEQLGRCLGFFAARVGLLRRIESELPTLSDRARTTREAYEKHFGPGIAQLRALLLSRGQDRAQTLASIEKSVQDELSKQKLDASEIAKAFDAETLSPQSQAVRYVMPMLAFDPAQQNHPELAWDAGFRATLTIPGTESTDPPVGSILLPMNFDIISSTKEPIATTLAFSGVGPATITVGVSLNALNFTAPDIIKQLKETQVPGTTLIESETKVVDSPFGPAALVVMDVDLAAAGQAMSNPAVKPAKGRITNYFVTTKMHIVSIATEVHALEGPNQAERLKALREKFEPLFTRVRTGLTINPPKAPQPPATPAKP
ncbi:MAG: hypothetical protein IBJ18_14310 [Phycisphaerales bacterium]|nr:hypothetical protein [Phycisphaerales bacterium]